MVVAGSAVKAADQDEVANLPSDRFDLVSLRADFVIEQGDMRRESCPGQAEARIGRRSAESAPESVQRLVATIGCVEHDRALRGVQPLTERAGVIEGDEERSARQPRSDVMTGLDSTLLGDAVRYPEQGQMQPLRAGKARALRVV